MRRKTQISRFGWEGEGREAASGFCGGRRVGQMAVAGVGHAAAMGDLEGPPGGERGWA